MAKKPTAAFRFQYIGDGAAQTGLEIISRKKGNPDDPDVLHPGDVVVVASPDEANYLRSLSNFMEAASPTSDKPTHRKKKAPAKKAAAKKKEEEVPADAGQTS